MIACLKELEDLGAEIDCESQVDMILQSLSDSISQYRVNVSMNKNAYTLFELVNVIVAVECLLKAKAIMDIAQASSTELKGGKKEVFQTSWKASCQRSEHSRE